MVLAHLGTVFRILVCLIAFILSQNVQSVTRKSIFFTWARPRIALPWFVTFPRARPSTKRRRGTRTHSWSILYKVLFYGFPQDTIGLPFFRWRFAASSTSSHATEKNSWTIILVWPIIVDRASQFKTHFTSLCCSSVIKFYVYRVNCSRRPPISFFFFLQQNNLKSNLSTCIWVIWVVHVLSKSFTTQRATMLKGNTS